MAIKGLTDNQAAFPQIGKLRKGGVKQKSGNKEIAGRDLTYFRFDSSDSKAAADFSAAYGSEPDTINVFLPYPETDRNFLTCKEKWTAGGLEHRCDGEFVSVLKVGKNYQRQFAKPVKCPGGCKEVGRLLCIIPELKRFAYVTAETHSLNDIANLHQQLKAVETTFGRLNSIPFVLRRRPQQISTPFGEGDRRTRVEKWMLSIEINPEWASLQIEATRVAALHQARSSYLLGSDTPAPTLSLPSAKNLPQAEVIEVLDFSYKDSALWQEFMQAVRDADSHDRIDILERSIYDKLISGGLPKHARSAIEREISIGRDRINSLSAGLVQVEAVPAPLEPETEHPNTTRIKQWMAFVGFTTEQIKSIRTSLNLPVASKLNPDQMVQFRDAIFMAWALTQGVFNAPQHAHNSYKKLLEALPPDATDEQIWASWLDKVASKKQEISVS